MSDGSKKNIVVRIFGRIWQVIKIYFFMIGLSVFAFFLLIVAFLYQKGLDLSLLFLPPQQIASTEKPAEPTDEVAVALELDGLLREDYLHSHNSYRLRGLFGSKMDYSMRSLRRTLKTLEKHPKVKAVLLHLGPTLDLSFQQARSLLSDLKSLKGKKPLYFYASSYGDNTFLLSAVGTKIVLMPGGEVQLFGANIITSHYGSVMKKFGVGMDVIKVGRYKDVGSPFTEAPSNEGKEVLAELVNTLVEQKINHITKVKSKLSKEKVTGWFEKQLFYDTEALEQGLITEISEIEEFKQRSMAFEPTIWVDYDDFSWEQSDRDKTTDQKRRRRGYFSRWKKSSKKDESKEDSVGLLEYQGAIVAHSYDRDTISAHQVAEDVDWMIKADHVKAVVMFIDSGGGGAQASEMIWSHLRRLAEVKPLVAYTTTAASGGYYMAVAAHKIIADPSAITGSIGVIGMVANYAKLAEEYGITSQAYSKGEILPELMDPIRSLSQETKDYLKDSMQRFYEVFLDRVAMGRKMEAEKIHNTAAQGRIWLGSQALNLGLIDQLGTLKTALREAAKLADSSEIKPDETFPVVYPKKSTSPLLECLDDPLKCLLNSEQQTSLPGFLVKLLSPAELSPQHAFINAVQRLKSMERIQARLWLDLAEH